MKYYVKVFILSVPLSFLIGSWWSVSKQEKQLKQLRQNKREVVVLAPAKAIPQAFIGAFEKLHQTKIILRTYTSTQDLVNDALTQTGTYDIVLYSSYEASKLIEEELFQPLAKNNIPLISTISVDFKNLSFDPKFTHSLPITWGVKGFIGKDNTAERSLVHLIESSKKGTVSILPDSNELFSLLTRIHPEFHQWLIEERSDLVQTTVENLSKSVNPNSDDPVRSIEDGTILYAQMAHGRYALLKKSGLNLEYWLPNEKASLTLLLASVSSTSLNHNLSHLFLNFLLKPENNEKIAISMGHGTVLTSLEKSNLPEMMKASYVRQFTLNKLQVGHRAIASNEIWQDVVQKVFKGKIN